MGNGAYAGLTQSTLDRVIGRLRQSDPQLFEQIRSRRGTGARGQIEPYQLTPQEWALILRNDLDVAMRWAGGGGVQSLEAIGNAAPDRGSRELAAAIPSLLFSESDDITIRILNEEINNVIRALPREVRERLPPAAVRGLPEDRQFRRQTTDAIVALSQLGYADALRSAIVRRIPERPRRPGQRDRFMQDKREWLEGHRFLR